MSVHFGGICFFDTDTEFVSFAFRGNRKDSPSSRTLSRICCRSSVSEIKTVSPAYLMLFTLRPFITTPFSSLIFLKNYLYTLKLIKDLPKPSLDLRPTSRPFSTHGRISFPVEISYPSQLLSVVIWDGKQSLRAEPCRRPLKSVKQSIDSSKA